MTTTPEALIAIAGMIVIAFALGWSIGNWRGFWNGYCAGRTDEHSDTAAKIIAAKRAAYVTARDSFHSKS